QLIAQNPVPNPPQSQKMAIVGATLHLGNGEVIENGQVLFSDGKIESVSNTSTDTPSGYEIVDGSGKHVYPGLIALLSGLGLTEIGAVRATRDGRETGLLNPNVRALIAFNTDSQIIPTVRSRGIMLAQIVPSGGRISGKSSVVEMDGWNWEDAVRRADEGVHINWPRLTTFNWRERTYKANEKYEEQVTALKNFLKQAAAYCTDGRVGETQLKLAAMCEAMKGEATLYIHTGYARSIQEAVLAMKELGVKPVIAGGYESFMVTDFLKQEDISVILYSTQSLPEEEDDDVDQPFKTPAQLAEAGVDFALSHGNNWDQRNIPFTVGTAVAYGLPYERAIQSITLNAAKILGIDETYGSLEAGKSATLIVVDGDVLDMRTSEVEMAFIDGRKVDLDNKQAELERKFREKYRRGE
ncbi:MAG: amidohydrolase family protein, partial [Bacteroidota bacterium]